MTHRTNITVQELLDAIMEFAKDHDLDVPVEIEVESGTEAMSHALSVEWPNGDFAVIIEDVFGE